MRVGRPLCRPRSPKWPCFSPPHSIRGDDDEAPQRHGRAKGVEEGQTETDVGTRSDVDFIDGDTVDGRADVGANANANANAHVDGACDQGID